MNNICKQLQLNLDTRYITMNAYKFKEVVLGSFMGTTLMLHAFAETTSIEVRPKLEGSLLTADIKKDNEKSLSLPVTTSITGGVMQDSVEELQAQPGIAPASSLIPTDPLLGTVKDTLKKGVEYSAGLPAAQSSLQAAAESLSKNRRLWLPTVAFTTRAQTSFSAARQPRMGVYQRGQNNNVNAAVSVTQNLYKGGELSARIDAAEANLRIQAAMLTQKEIKVLITAAAAYLDVVRDRKSLEISKKNVENLEKQVEAARVRYEVGEDTITSVVTSESYLAEARARKIEADAKLAASETTYVATTGELPPPHMEFPSLPSHLPASLNDAIKIALQNNPDLKVEDGKYKAAQADAEGAVSSLLPSLDLEVTASRNLNSSRARNYPYATPYKKNNTNDVTAAVVLRVPLDFSGLNQAAIRERKQTAVAQRLNLADMQNVILGKVNQLWASFQSYSARIQWRQKQVETSGFAVKQVQEEFKVGNKSYTDVLIVENKDYEARTSLISTQRDQIATAYELLGVLGTLTIRELDLGVTSMNVDQMKEEAMDHIWGTAIKEASSITTKDDPRAIAFMESEQKQAVEDYNVR